MEGYEKENKEAKVRLLGSRGQVVKVYLLLNRLISIITCYSPSDNNR